MWFLIESKATKKVTAKKYLQLIFYCFASALKNIKNTIYAMIINTNLRVRAYYKIN